MGLDKFESDLFPYLSLREKALLKGLSELDGVSYDEEIKLLILARVRAMGRLRILLDGQDTQLSEDKPKPLYLKDLEIEPEPK